MRWFSRGRADAEESARPTDEEQLTAQPRGVFDALVSAIVPCYNVAPYLDECLESIVGQTHQNVEIIAIDDGSTDGTAAILARWASERDRMTVITQPNAGLGAARNAGLAVATGDYITFVDSDDKLPEHSIAAMVASAETTGSDIVTGVTRRFDGEHTWKVSLHLRMFTVYRPRTHIFERPSLVRDHIVCGKLFRRDFWEREGLRFPEGVLFEDIELATRAHCLAGAVDIVPDPLYLWRRRPEGDLSITQDRTRPGGVSGRFAALAGVDKYLRQHAPETVWKRHARKVFEADLAIYAVLLDDADDRYCVEFMTSAASLMELLAPDAVAAQGELQRCLRRQILNGDLRGVRGTSRLLHTEPKSFSAVVTGFVMLPMRDRLALVMVGVRSLWRRRPPLPSPVRTSGQRSAGRAPNP